MAFSPSFRQKPPSSDPYTARKCTQPLPQLQRRKVEMAGRSPSGAISISSPGESHGTGNVVSAAAREPIWLHLRDSFPAITNPGKKRKRADYLFSSIDDEEETATNRDDMLKAALSVTSPRAATTNTAASTPLPQARAQKAARAPNYASLSASEKRVAQGHPFEALEASTWREIVAGVGAAEYTRAKQGSGEESVKLRINRAILRALGEGKQAAEEMAMQINGMKDEIMDLEGQLNVSEEHCTSQRGRIVGPERQLEAAKMEHAAMTSELEVLRGERGNHCKELD